MCKLVFTIVLLAFMFKASAQKADSLVVKTDSIPLKYQGLHKRSPILAWALSTYAPGVGQFYNRQYTKGAIIIGGIGLSALGAIIVNNKLDPNRHYTDAPAGLYIFSLVGFYMYGIADAPLSATSINRKYHLPGRHLQQGLSNIQIAPTLINTADYAFYKPVFGLKLTLR